MSDKWHSHFLRMALLCAQMSKDPNTQVGAVIVGPDREVRSTGFNGLPRGVADTAERLHDRETKLKLIVHAEMNAVLNAARHGVALKGCTVYLACKRPEDVHGLNPWGGPPCTRCTVELIQAGIVAVIAHPKKAVPSRWAEDLAVAELLLQEAGVTYREETHHEG